MPNRLANAASPYLQQHADNPVDWWPWGQEPFAEAAASGKPVLLSIGYAACHWCHVMAHDSFEDAETAAVMNRLFVNIKVDREERPDIDQIYMAALHALGQQGGWPLTMFLKATGEPFWGGTYFPKKGAYGRPGFVDALTSIATVFHQDPERIEQNGRALLQHLQESHHDKDFGRELTEDVLDLALMRLAKLMDRENGGLAGAPKFPQPPLLHLFLDQARRKGDDDLSALVLLTLDRICQGGIYDHLGGGFARYSVDARWLVPHFEKMLYDNGQLLSLLARGYQQTRSSLFRIRINETAAWLSREMRVDGAYASSLDADTNGVEGLTYLWTKKEVEGVLGPEAPSFAAAYDVTGEGNFEGRSILNRLKAGSGLDEEKEERLSDLRLRLKSVRDQRPQPGRDDKILSDWNGFAIKGLADAGVATGNDGLITEARSVYEAVVALMEESGHRLAHARRGSAAVSGFASDHAAMATAALALYHATFDPRYIWDAERWVAVLDHHYGDGKGRYYLTAQDADPLIIRPLGFFDEATPNHHGLLAAASVRLYLLTGKEPHLLRADEILRTAASFVLQNVLGGASLLSALIQRLDLTSVVIVGPDTAKRRSMVDAVRKSFPDAVHFVTESGADLRPSHPAYGKKAAAEVAAYICRSQTCSAPIQDPEAFISLRTRAEGLFHVNRLGQP